jgi:hypothetical protein
MVLKAMSPVGTAVNISTSSPALNVRVCPSPALW